MTTTITQLPAPIPTTTRDAEIEKWKRSHRIRVPGADTGDGSQPDTDAKICADILMPLYAAAEINNRNTVLELAREAALDQWAEREGVDPRRDEYGASGSVIFAGSPGGATLVEGDEIKEKSANLRYRVIRTDHYVPGDLVDIVGKDTGPATNLPAGTQLEWTSPRPGCSDFADVAAQSDGSGLSGGRLAESDEEFLARIQQEKRTRAASGNDAEYQLEAERTPNVAMQKAFTYPAVLMAGTTCVTFTMLPQRSGGSRAPNSAQVALVESHLYGEFPGDDGLMMGLIADQPTDVVYGVEWTDAAVGWADLAPWPKWYPVAPTSGPGAVVVILASSATSFSLGTTNGIYTDVRTPQVGQSLAFYDQASFTWRQKRIATIIGSGPWAVTCDTANNASDVSYVPALGQRACPWSDSLESLLPGLWRYFDTLGPGEQRASFYDAGRRQRRQPQAPGDWDHSTTTRGLSDAAEEAAAVADVEVLEGDDVTPAIGVPGVLSYQLLLRWVSVFPKS